MPTNLFVAGGCFFAATYAFGKAKEGASLNRTPDTETIDALVGFTTPPKAPRYIRVTGQKIPRVGVAGWCALRDEKSNRVIYIKKSNPYESGEPKEATIEGMLVPVPSEDAFLIGGTAKDLVGITGPYYLIGNTYGILENQGPPSVPLWSALGLGLVALGLTTLAALRWNNTIFVRDSFATVREIHEFDAPELANSGLTASGPYLEAADPRPVLDIEANLQFLGNGEIILNTASAGGSVPLGRIVGRSVEIGTFYCGFQGPRRAVRVNGSIVLAVPDSFPIERLIASLGTTPSNGIHAPKRAASAMPAAA